MNKLSYGDALSDSLRLVSKNLYVLIPSFLNTVLVSVLVLLFYIPLFESMTNLRINASLILSMILIYVAFIILSVFTYGWTLAIIGKIAKKGKTNLMEELKRTPKIALRVFLVGLLFFLMLLGIYLLVMLVFLLFGVITAFVKFLGILLFIIGGFGLIFLVFLYLIIALNTLPVLALEDIGAMKTIQLAFSHFKKNKGHCTALFFIALGLLLAISIVLLLILFALLGKSNLLNPFYMFQHPVAYTAISLVLSIPSIFVYMWIIMFLTISYSRKKGVKAA